MKSIFLKAFSLNIVQKSFLSFKQDLPRIVYYHLVSDRSNIPYYYNKNLFSSDLLEDQLKWFIKNGYKFVTLNEAFQLIQNNESATKTIAFTSDDGFKENYFTMAPIFNEYNIKPTLFLISNCIDNKDLNWDCKVFLIKNSIASNTEKKICEFLSDKYNLRRGVSDIIGFRELWPMPLKEEIVNDAWELARLIPLDEYLGENEPYMTINQIKELLSNGYCVGSHSKSHPNFSKLTKEDAIIEMADSKNVIKEKLGIDPIHFAYPYGKRPSEIVEDYLIKKEFFKLYFGTKSNLTNSKGNIFWERDKMEQGKLMSQFWFTAVPFLRNIVLHPLKVYK